MENMTGKRNYNAIDLARMTGACLTVAAHAWFFLNDLSSPVTTVLYWGIYQYSGRLFIPFFIMTSSFFHYRKSDPGSITLQYSAGYLKRFFRLYLIWTAIYFPLALLNIIRDPKGSIRHGVPAYIRNVIFSGDQMHLWFMPALIVAVFLVTFFLSKGVKPSGVVGIAFFFYLIGMFGQTWFGFLIPLREKAPAVWNALRFGRHVILTTRNGLFYGFLFAAMGMCFAYYGVMVSRRQAAAGFIISFICMGIEIMVFEKIGFTREHDMTIFLIPAEFFLFSFLLQTDLPDRPFYRLCRKTSALIYFVHIWVIRLLTVPLEWAGIYVPQSFLLFVYAFAGSLLAAYLIITLPERGKCRWLKNLY